ncbi:YceI family protein [Allosphingosinicella flava]|uniref:YceI family protein n=1 Tax=Allosphingosinicella flava TaxID=2771430 RepID=A0A7T2GJ92_9SPHN|nr:YceI family protein [Sphingosinicella flava]QPQ54897.1 YceI family protein [Sphingosinicella flava]
MRTTLIAFAALAATVATAQATQQPAPTPAAAEAVKGGAYALDKSHAKIVWGVSHLGFSTYYGEFTDFDAQLTLDAAKPENSKLTVTIDLNSVDTHNEKLDAHLKNPDFFDVAKYPAATFASTRVQRTGPTTAEVTGDLTLHGMTKPVTLFVTLNKAAPGPMTQVYTAGFSAEATIDRTQFGMTTYAPALGKDVKLLISGEFNLKS